MQRIQYEPGASFIRCGSGGLSTKTAPRLRPTLRPRRRPRRAEVLGCVATRRYGSPGRETLSSHCRVRLSGSNYASCGEKTGGEREQGNREGRQRGEWGYTLGALFMKEFRQRGGQLRGRRNPIFDVITADPKSRLSAWSHMCETSRCCLRQDSASREQFCLTRRTKIWTGVRPHPEPPPPCLCCSRPISLTDSHVPQHLGDRLMRCLNWLLKIKVRLPL